MRNYRLNLIKEMEWLKLKYMRTWWAISTMTCAQACGSFTWLTTSLMWSCFLLILSRWHYWVVKSLTESQPQLLECFQTNWMALVERETRSLFLARCSWSPPLWVSSWISHLCVKLVKHSCTLGTVCCPQFSMLDGQVSRFHTWQLSTNFLTDRDVVTLWLMAETYSLTLPIFSCLSVHWSSSWQ